MKTNSSSSGVLKMWKLFWVRIHHCSDWKERGFYRLKDYKDFTDFDVLVSHWIDWMISLSNVPMPLNIMTTILFNQTGFICSKQMSNADLCCLKSNNLTLYMPVIEIHLKLSSYDFRDHTKSLEDLSDHYGIVSY